MASCKIRFFISVSRSKNLIIVAERPGRIKVYQEEFLIASLVDGELIKNSLFSSISFISDIANNGLELLGENFSVPKYEHARDFENFWFVAYCNFVSSITNSISVAGHGGMIIILPDGEHNIPVSLRLKYNGKSSIIKDAFVKFINSRNNTADFYEKAEINSRPISKGIFKAELEFATATEQMVETARFVSQLAGCDGSIVISSDLILLGFGAEIRTEIKQGISVTELITDGHPREYRPCDVEQFGMRHRSAVKFASQVVGALVLAISQDGPITAVWRDGEKVVVKKGVSLGNFNAPWL